MTRTIDQRPGPDSGPGAATPDPGWLVRQGIMEAWYRELATDPTAARGCFDHDYGELAPLLQTIEGRVVDIGGGLGLARHFLPSPGTYVVVEPSPFWREQSWPRLEQAYPLLHTPVALVRGIGEQLPFAEGIFDGALALWSLNHTSDPERVVREAVRVLRPGGRFVVVLEDMRPTANDLLTRPDLAALATPTLQPDHLEITETSFIAAAAGCDVVERRWIKHYLTFVLTKRRAPVARRSTVVPAETPASRSRHDAPAAGRTASADIHVRDLVWTLIRTDLKTRYHDSIGGFAWALLKPAAMFLVLLAVFSFVFTTDPAYRLNLVLGLFLWDFFAESTTNGLIALHAKGYLLSKARFPAWVLVVTSASNALVRLAIFSAILVPVLIVMGRAPGIAALLLYFVYALALLVIVTGMSLASSVLFVRYRDLNQVWEVAIQAGFFAAPIVYPLSIIPERFHPYMYLWPPTQVVQLSRSVLVEQTIPSLPAHAWLALMSAATLAGGVLVHRRLVVRTAEYL